MRWTEVAFFYLCVGLAVASRLSGARRWLGLALWPLFLPLLLAPEGERFDTAPGSAPSDRISRSFERLRQALTLWDPGAPLPLEAAERALADLDRRHRALSALLEAPEEGPSGPARARRRQGVEALIALRDRLGAEIDEALARTDELTARIQLAYFGGGTLDVGPALAALVERVEGLRIAQGEVESGARASGGG